MNSWLLLPSSCSQFVASSSTSTPLSLPTLLLPLLIGRATLLRCGETLCCLARDRGDNGSWSTPPGRFSACSVAGRASNSVIPLMPSLMKPKSSASPSSSAELAIPTGAAALNSAVHLFQHWLTGNYPQDTTRAWVYVPAGQHALAACPCAYIVIV